MTDVTYQYQLKADLIRYLEMSNEQIGFDIDALMLDSQSSKHDSNAFTSSLMTCTAPGLEKRTHEGGEVRTRANETQQRWAGARGGERLGSPYLLGDLIRRPGRPLPRARPHAACERLRTPPAHPMRQQPGQPTQHWLHGSAFW